MIGWLLAALTKLTAAVLAAVAALTSLGATAHEPAVRLDVPPVTVATGEPPLPPCDTMLVVVKIGQWPGCDVEPPAVMVEAGTDAESCSLMGGTALVDRFGERWCFDIDY